MMSVDVMNRIRAFGDYQHLHAVTVTLPTGAIHKLFERPGSNESPYFPTYSATTGASNRLVVGDWSHMVIARRTGMTVETVPHLVSTTNARPIGSRGFFVYGRIGSNSVQDGAWRMQSNT